MKEFKPTYLYIKQHNITGLKYFGKTQNSDPVKYKGSGTYWMRHLKVHGNDVTTLWHQLFVDESELTKYAEEFSLKNQIKESKEWANIINENGLDGVSKGSVPWNVGIPREQKVKDAVSEANTGKVAWNKGVKRTDEEKALMSQRRREGNAKKREQGLPTCWNQGTERSEEDCQKMKDGWAKKTADPSYVKTKHGNEGWSAGLTKETDERIATRAKAQKGKVPWNKGITYKNRKNR